MEDYKKLDINSMLIKLARYPMEERLTIMMEPSIKFVKNDFDVLKSNINNELQPWEMETFLLLCIMANNKFISNTFQSKKGQTEKNKILNNIRMEMECWDKYSESDLSILLLTAIGNLQFPIQQQNFLNTAYRLSFLFNDKEVKSEYLQKFKVEYDEIVSFVELLIVLFNKMNYQQPILKYLFRKYSVISSNFIMSYEQIVNKQKILTPIHDDYKYGFKIFTSYPFILYDSKYYIPLPHTLKTACGNSMLIRLTSENQNNDELRKNFGSIFEKYLFKIISDSGLHSLLSDEIPYIKKP